MAKVTPARARGPSHRRARELRPEAPREVGLALEVDRRERADRLGPGDGVLLCTGGVVERRGGGSRCGTKRLGAALRHGNRLAPAEMLELLERDLRESAAERISGDVCRLALRGE